MRAGTSFHRARSAGPTAGIGIVDEQPDKSNDRPTHYHGRARPNSAQDCKQ